MAQRLQGRRQPHHHHPHVPRHGQRHAAQHLRLRLPRRPLAADQGRERQGHQTLAVGQQRAQVSAHLLAQLHIQFRLVRPGITAHQQPKYPGDRIRTLQLQDRRQPPSVRQPRLAQRPMTAYPPRAVTVSRQPSCRPDQHLLWPRQHGPCTGHLIHRPHPIPRGVQHAVLGHTLILQGHAPQPAHPSVLLTRHPGSLIPHQLPMPHPPACRLPAHCPEMLRHNPQDGGRHACGHGALQPSPPPAVATGCNAMPTCSDNVNTHRFAQSLSHLLTGTALHPLSC